MRVVFNHIEGFGKVSQQDFIYSQPHGELEPGEDISHVLDRGWIPWQGRWYNLRSVRIDTHVYRPSKTTRRLAKRVTPVLHPFQDDDVYQNIYHAYCNQRGFRRTIEWEELRTSDMIAYYYENHLVGYSCVELGKDMIASQFVWDYAAPALSLGKIAQMYEVEIAREKGCRYVYILGGYESCCLYKGEFEGMEWWTGSAWSKDRMLYSQLCKRDDSMIVDMDDYDIRTV